ncbi:Protein PIH1D3 PIH1 domain-containing protein 3 Sarcoma antigen NY-SAR-97 [Channa argus]|uniref:Protein PIH1D3 PIH1 domain-containing protein 3 Sarcoma antigen NY-SAR-97 n=1 Tax=Channa argus TaxID=215402 RepID=A0A6G1Q7Q0_CHAAH|nr:Protein PIH1D3 PIH1 domain-containing protein 3 Sarcoma antigen NY-SAR-97 [Channa argus]
MECLGVSSVQNLQALSALLSPQEDEEEEESKNVSAYAQLGPGHIGPTPKQDKDVSTPCVQRNGKDIWSEEEVAEGSQYDDLADPRPQPDKLGLHLPHPTHSQEGKAQFFSERQELEVTLLLKRPMDYINMQ